MKNFLALVIIVIFFKPTLFSQTKFQSGYIVENSGDTIVGYVENLKESESFLTCHFKSSETANPVEYSPEKIKAYGIFKGRKYYSAKLENRMFFLAYLVKGNLSLLSFETNIMQFFILDQHGKIMELKESLIIESSSNQFYSDYKELLIAKMKQANIYQDIRKTQLEENSLVPLFVKYNAQTNSSFEIVAKTKSKSIFRDYSIFGTNKFKFGIIGGISLVNYKVASTGVDYKYIGEAKFNTIKSPVFGIYFESGLLRMIPGIAFKSELWFQKVSIYGYSRYDHKYYSTIKYYDDIFIDYSNIKLRGSLKYDFNFRKIKVGPYLGLSYNYKTKTNYYRFSQENNTNLNVIKSTEYNDLKFLKSKLSYLGGISFGYAISSARIINLNIDYEIGINVLDKIEKVSYYTTGFSDKESNINITLGISI
jgi:hypothetical protein